ncbi:hypothetical protein GCM10023340_33870 [Nocardioides marinquilinus]|uniref:WXG100 family type VII secretion target n=1 Tax=Nocardioides marinquilinus TaxID=1210400 RepID=A0ABP9PW34_9ACTN
MSALQLQELGPFLREPEVGTASLKHNESFEEFSEIYTGVVSRINRFLDLLPIDLGPIPEDLYDTLVVPLAGDYGKIKQNGDACDVLRTGMHAWAGNVGDLRAEAGAVWEGQAAEAFMNQADVYALVMDGLGAIMRLGTLLFNGIGTMSEKLGIVVENIIVKGAKLIVKVAKKVAEKVAGWFGWLSLAKDVLTRGLEYFRDLWEDIQTALNLFDQTKALKEHVEEWAQAERDRLKAFDKLPDVMEKLPHVSGHDLLTGTVDPSLRTDLADLKDALTGKRAQDALEKIRKDLDDLSETTGDEAPDLSDDPVTEGQEADDADAPTESGGGQSRPRAS